MNKDPFTIIIDTREQIPWEFGFHNTAKRKLDTGDYSIEGLESIIAIERKKSVSEIATNITEKRFKDVLDRMKQYKYSFFIMEFDLNDVYRYPIGSSVPKHKWNQIKISPAFIIKNLLEIQLIHNIHIIYSGDSDNASKIALTLMKKVYELEYNKKEI